MSDVTTLKIAALEECGAVRKCQSHPSGYEQACTSSYTYTKPTKERVAAHALQQLEAARAKDVETHEKNLPGIESNKAVVAAVTELMDGIGMPKKWSERDRNSRSRYPKTITNDAGYITDLRRECKTDDGFDLATRSYTELKQRYEQYAAEGKKDAEAAARERELAQQREVEKRKADMELAAVLLRYGLPLESTWGDVLDTLRARDQRLDLAVAMQQTRGDWSNGPYRVREALGRFTITTDDDKDIAACVAEGLYDFEDGRVFRDMAWSYDALFASVEDRQLVADVQLALRHREDQ